MEGINGDMKNKKKIILIILIILLIIIIGIVVAYKLIENGVINRENFNSMLKILVLLLLTQNTRSSVKNKENIEWDEITEEGVNEELLFQNVNTIDLEKIAALLQSLSAEIAQKEKKILIFI